ncbi:MAG TPA: Sir2 family NAD-dependent protein deacetylase [Ktedonobacteraceae bacterium]
MQTVEEQLRDAAELLRGARRIVALTGAGISTESGIPDFRSPGSTWRDNPPVSYPDFISQPEARRQYWATRRGLLKQVLAARPNPAHLALVALERRQALLGVVTQNFDGLHLDAGHDPARVVEIHGTSREAACTLCDARSPIEEIQSRVDEGEDDPRCQFCGGYIKSATILFGQHIPGAVLARAQELARGCDLFLVVGSSLQVSPAAHLPRLALKNAAPLLIINLMPTPLDSAASVVIQEKAGLALPRLVEML